MVQYALKLMMMPLGCEMQVKPAVLRLFDPERYPDAPALSEDQATWLLACLPRCAHLPAPAHVSLRACELCLFTPFHPPSPLPLALGGVTCSPEERQLLAGCGAGLQRDLGPVERLMLEVGGHGLGGRGPGRGRGGCRNTNSLASRPVY